MDWKRIIWLASYPKSGSTWVRCFLDAYAMGEVDINDLVCSVSDDNGNRAHLGPEHTDIIGEPVDVVQMARPMALLRLVDAWNQGRVPDLPLWVKTHNACLVANGFELLPVQLTLAVVHIVRDPRPILPSFANHLGKDLDYTLESMLDVYRVLDGRKQRKMPDLISSWGKHCTSFMNDTEHNVLTIRYEDMKADPVPCFAQILHHSGVEPDEERIVKALDLVDLSKLRQQERDGGFREQSKYAQSEFFGGKREKPTIRHTNALERRFRLQMKRLGYLGAQSKAA